MSPEDVSSGVTSVSGMRTTLDIQNSVLLVAFAVHNIHVNSDVNMSKGTSYVSPVCEGNQRSKTRTLFCIHTNESPSRITGVRVTEMFTIGLSIIHMNVPPLCEKLSILRLSSSEIVHRTVSRFVEQESSVIEIIKSSVEFHRVFSSIYSHR